MNESLTISTTSNQEVTKPGLYSLKGAGDTFNIYGTEDDKFTYRSTDTAEFYDIVNDELADVDVSDETVESEQTLRKKIGTKLGRFASSLAGVANRFRTRRETHLDSDSQEANTEDGEEEASADDIVSKWRMRGALALGMPGAAAKKVAAHSVGRMKIFNKEGGRLGNLGESGRHNSRMRRHEGESDADYYARMKKNGKVTLAMGSAAIGSAVTVATGGAAAGGAMLATRVAVKGGVGVGMGIARYKLSGEQKTKKELAKNIGMMTSISMLAGIATAEAVGHGFINRGGETVWSKATSAVKSWRHEPSFDYTADNIKLAADTQILIGGRGMPDGDAMRPVANGLGLHANKTIGIDYPAGIKTWVTPEDTHTLDESSKIGADKIYAAYQANKHGTVELVGYSEGTQPLEDALDRIAQENGGRLPDNISVKIIASPNTENSGVFNDPKAKFLKPLFDANGATMDRPIPQGKNVKVIAMNTDFWANAGNRPPSTMISQAIGLASDGHRAPSADLRHTSRVVNGVTYETYYHNGTQNAALRTAEAHGFKVTKKADEFASALAPTGELGEENVRVNAADVLRTGSAAAEEAMTLNGINPQHAKIASDIIANIPPAPVQQVFNAVQDIPNGIAQGLNGQAPAGPAWQAPVASFAPQVTPEYVAQGVSNVENFVNNTANQAAAATGGNQEAANVVRGAQATLNGLLGSIGR